MDSISIIWIIKYSHVSWDILLISIDFTSSHGFNFVWSWHKFFLPSNVVFNVCEDFRVVVVILFVFRNLKLLFEDHFALVSKGTSSAGLISTSGSAVEMISFKFKITFAVTRVTSSNLTSLTHVKSEIIIFIFTRSSRK